MTNTKRFMLSYKFVEGQVDFDLADLVYIESNLHRCLFHFVNNTVLNTYRKLDDIEELIADDRMLRIHKSYLINIDYCSRISNYSLWLRDGRSFSVPRVRYHHVKECFLRRRLEEEGKPL